MPKKTLSTLVAREKKYLQRSEELLRYRRINWLVETNHRIRYAFERLATTARAQNYPFRLNVRQFDQPNECVIQISSSPRLTGVGDKIITHDPSMLGHDSYSPIVEKGGVLVASQSVSGHVAFIVYPRESERVKSLQRELILYEGLDPADITESVIDRAIRRYLLYLRGTSLFGMHDALTVMERVLLIYMRLSDIRYRYKLSRSLLSMENEWAKLVAAALGGVVVGYFTGSSR